MSLVCMFVKLSTLQTVNVEIVYFYPVSLCVLLIGLCLLHYSSAFPVIILGIMFLGVGFAFSALTLLVASQEGHLACKN